MKKIRVNVYFISNKVYWSFFASKITGETQVFIDRRFPKKDEDFQNYKIAHLEEMLCSACLNSGKECY